MNELCNKPLTYCNKPITYHCARQSIGVSLNTTAQHLRSEAPMGKGLYLFGLKEKQRYCPFFLLVLRFSPFYKEKRNISHPDIYFGRFIAA
jgi:hypothetical protein